jgi:ABC-type multidrug transport system permease subunit
MFCDQMEPLEQPTLRAISFYFLAALAGIGIGCADVLINDLLFTALLVLASAMFFGLLGPRRPWRWVIVIVFFVPVTEFAAYLLTAIKPTRAQVYGSVLTALPGIAGAYGGSLMRTVLDNLRQGK